MIIAVDVDGVVADLSAEWYRRYNAEFNDDLHPGRVTDWDTRKFVKPEAKGRIFEYLKESDLYAKVPVIAGALEGVTTLRTMGHRVVFVSSCVPGAMDQKYTWLLDHGFVPGGNLGGQSKDVIFAHSKDLIKADALVDDGPHNIDAFPGAGILIDALYNRDMKRKDYFRVSGWADVPNTVSIIAHCLAKAS